MRFRTFVGALAVVALGGAGPLRAAACATCGCGDPTLAVMGAEAPFEGRIRLYSQLRYRWDTIGADRERTTQHEGQLLVGGSWAPHDRVVLSAALPVVLRSVSWANEGGTTVVGPGDLEVRSRVLLLRDRDFMPEHLLGLHAGIKLPTSLDQVRPDGRRLPVEAQTGSGTVDPIFGIFYTHLADPWSVFASAVVTLPLAGRFDEAPGPSLRGTAAVQYRFDRHITVRGGLDVRYDAPALIQGHNDPRSEQVTLFVSPDLLWSPVSDLVLIFGLRVPAVQVSEQSRSEGLYAQFGVVLDV